MSVKMWSEEDRDYWKKWKQDRDQAAGNELVRKYMPLVDFVVRRLSVTLPDTIHSSDLQSFGMHGLLDALDKFDLDRGLQFETYASFRIRGAIIDGLRKNDWVPRSVREKAKKIEEAYIHLEQEKLRSVTDAEISSYLGMDEQSVNQILVEASLSTMVSIDEPVFDEEEHSVDRHHLIENEQADSPEKRLNEQLLKDSITAVIDRLPEKEKIVVSLVYYEELNLTEVAKIMRLSTSRISQLHSKAMLRMKAAITKEHIQFQ